MALTDLGPNNTPNYTALSTDVSSSKITGASRIGNTVLLLDNGLWYIIQPDLTLVAYALPVGLAGTIDIGVADQGLKGTESWLVNNLPPITSVVIGALNGIATQTVTDITGATVGANNVFQGSVSISIAAQNPAATATGTIHAEISWVPGAGGSTARRVAAINLELPATAAALNGVSANDVISIPITVYAGTTGGKFRTTVVVTGVVTDLIWDVLVSGTSQ